MKKTLEYLITKYGDKYSDKEIIEAYIEVNNLIGEYKDLIDRMTEKHFPDDYKHLINKQTLIEEIEDLKGWYDRDTFYSADDYTQDVITAIEDAEEWG